MNDQNPYAAPQTPLQTRESASQLPAVLLPFAFAKGAKILLLTFWNPLSIVLMNAAYAIYEPLGPISAAIILAMAVRGYLPFCRAETIGQNVFLVVTVITALGYSLFVLTTFGLFSYREDAFRNTLLLWLIGNALMMIGIGLVAKEYRHHTLRYWSSWAFVFSMLLFASVLPLQTKWLGFDVLHRFAAWYYFVGISFYLINAKVLGQIYWTISSQSEKDGYQSLNKKPLLPARMEIPESLRRES